MKLFFFQIVFLITSWKAAAQNCFLPDQTEIQGTISELLQSSDASNTDPVTISSFQYTCQVQGDRRDTYRQLSVIATYTNAVVGTQTRHFQLQCQGNQWDPNLSEGLETPPNNFQSLSTRTDCRQCTNAFNDDHHCRPCSPPCPGLGRCPALDQCCSYFATDGTCTNNCTVSDGINYIATANTNFTCTCNLTCLPGETPNTDCTMCDVTDACLRYTPCQNGATCTSEGTNDYTCECVAGYTDKNCSTNIDDCSPNPCLNGGTCTDGINDYTCECVAGFTGRNCSINIDDCSPNPCLNGGTCTDGINDYTCECVAGFTGRNCSINIDDCSPNPCLNGGTCTDGINDYTCECVAGFTGKNCSNLIDDCSNLEDAFERRLCCFYYLLGKWRRRAVEFGFNIPDIIPQNTSLPHIEQWKAAKKQEDIFRTAWFDRANTAFTLPTPYSINDNTAEEWIKYAQVVTSTHEHWQMYIKDINQTVVLQDFKTINFSKDANLTSSFDSFKEKWLKDLSVFDAIINT